jgi:hypothetical protein
MAGERISCLAETAEQKGSGMKVLQRRWHDLHVRSKPRDKVLLDYSGLTGIVTKQIGDKLGTAFYMYGSDELYHCPPLEDAEEIIKQSALDRKTWVEERFDCDDFAVILKAHFAEAAYANGKRRAPHAFGIIHGVFEDVGMHAMNIMVNDDKQVRIVEPQNDQIFLVEESGLEYAHLVMF